MSQGEVLNISPFVVWAVALSQILSFGLTIWNLMASGGRANARRLDEHGKRIDEHDLRMAKVEQSVGSLPVAQDMHELQLAMEALKGELREMRAFIDGNNKVMARLEKVVERQEQFLLEAKR